MRFAVWAVASALVLVGCGEKRGQGESCNWPQCPRIVALNQDCTQFQAVFPAEKMTEAGAVEYFDQVAKEGITHFLINPHGHNTTYESKVWETVWRDGSALGLETPKDKLIDNMRICVARGVDVYGVWIRRAREQGIVPWLSMRMNDIHSIAKPTTFSRSTFWVENPRFRRVPGSDGSRWSEGAFDFAHPEVRAHALALAREMLEKWDVDGFECDWLRFTHHVTPEAERNRTGKPALTAFMRDLKKIVDEMSGRRGHPIQVGVRVAAMPDYADALGTDAFAWAAEGLVDWVVPCNFFECADYELPMAEWVSRMRTANPRVKVLAGADFAGVVRDASDRSENPKGFTLAEVAGYFELLLSEGAKGAYYFNRFQCNENDPIHRLVQIEGLKGAPERLRKMDRAYLVSFHDIDPEGVGPRKRLPVLLDRPRSLTVRIGKRGEPSGLRVRVAFDRALDDAMAADVRVNGIRATAGKAIDAKAWLEHFNKSNPSFAYEYECPSGALRDGGNEIVLRMRDGSTKAVTARACELYVDAKENR